MQKRERSKQIKDTTIREYFNVRMYVTLVYIGLWRVDI